MFIISSIKAVTLNNGRVPPWHGMHPQSVAHANYMGNPPHNWANLHTAKRRTANKRQVADKMTVREHVDLAPKQTFFVHLCQRNNRFLSIGVSDMVT